MAYFAFSLMSGVNHVTDRLLCGKGKNKTKGEKHLHFPDNQQQIESI